MENKVAETAATGLQRRATEWLAKQPLTMKSSDNSPTQRLLHELMVHQIELDMQGDELRHSRDEAQEALRRYADLYDFSPVSLLVLGHTGIIHQINLTGAQLLGAERAYIVGRHLADYLQPEARLAFDKLLKKALDSRLRESCVLALKAKLPEQPSFVRINAVRDTTRKTVHAALIDITEQRRLTEELAQCRKHLESLVALGATK